MEFFVGAMTTLICVVVFNKIIDKENSKYTKKIDLSDRQSYRFDQIRPALELTKYLIQPKEIDTQATRFFDSRHTTVALAEDKAYWIENNTLLAADVVDGNFEKENAKRVDTMAMDKVELNKIMYIVDQLSEATKNDRGNPGKPKL